MDEKNFAELKESVRQMKAILAGKEEPARRYTAAEVLGEERVALIEARKKMRLSQAPDRP